MKVSVIICAHTMERFHDVIEAANSILYQTYQNIELIISVDNNNQLFTNLKKTLPNNVVFVFNDSIRGLSETRNFGVRYASGDIVAFIDDDAIADEKWVQKIVDSYSDPEVVAVGGKLLPLWGQNSPWWFPEELYWIVGCTYKGHPNEKTKVRNLIGCNMSFRKTIFKKIGFFKKEIGRLNKIPLSGEEMEFCLRIEKNFNNEKILFNPEAIVFHKVALSRQTFTYIVKRSFGEGVSKKIINNFYAKRVLDTENKYIKYLLFNSLLCKLGNVFLFKEPIKNSVQLVFIFTVIICTFIGYVKTK